MQTILTNGLEGTETRSPTLGQWQASGDLRESQLGTQDAAAIRIKNSGQKV